MEDWELEFEWLGTRNKVRDLMNYDTEPDLQAILLLVGIQELGNPDIVYEKETKQNLMHIAVCRLLSDDGYYEFVGFDADGWPHYRNLVTIPEKGVKNQEKLLKKALIKYFSEV